MPHLHVWRLEPSFAPSLTSVNVAFKFFSNLMLEITHFARIAFGNQVQFDRKFFKLFASRHHLQQPFAGHFVLFEGSIARAPVEHREGITHGPRVMDIVRDKYDTNPFCLGLDDIFQDDSRFFHPSADVGSSRIRTRAPK